MSCLLPQFKCQPDTFSIHFRTTITTASASSHYHHFVNSSHSDSSKTREPIILRAQCILLATAPSSKTAAVLSIEKLRLPSLETKVESATKQRSWVYENFEATLASETLLNSEEAIISAASAEALALAKAAVKLAKEAAFFVSNTQSSCSFSRGSTYSNPNLISSKGSRFVESEQASAKGEFMGGDFRVEEVDSLKCADSDFDDGEETYEELEFIEELAESVAVRSIRQSERKAKRLRAVKKAASGVVLVKSGSAGRKKRNALNNVDYSDPLHYIRATTSSSKLLSAKEELELSEGIQDLLKLERLQEELAERCGDRPTFAQWATAAGVDQRTLRKRINNGIYSKDKMIKSNIRLVISIAKNYQRAGMNLQDLVQEGCRGLIRGAEKFDASKGFKFSTYAHWWIKQSLRKSLSDQSRTIRLPFHMVEATYRVKEARKQLYTQNGTLPSDEEVAAMAGLSMKRLSAVLLIPKAPRSLEQKIGIDQNLKPSEVISDPEAETSEDVLMKQFMKDDLEKVLNSLNPREKQIIQWRYGLGDGRMKTLQEIGEIMGVSRERIRQIELCAFRKLKSKKRTVNLQQYLIS